MAKVKVIQPVLEGVISVADAAKVNLESISMTMIKDLPLRDYTRVASILQKYVSYGVSGISDWDMGYIARVLDTNFEVDANFGADFELNFDWQCLLLQVFTAEQEKAAQKK